MGKLGSRFTQQAFRGTGSDNCPHQLSGSVTMRMLSKQIKILLLAIIPLLTFSCKANESNVEKPPALPAGSNFNSYTSSFCKNTDEWDFIPKQAIYIFGERHGTIESPSFVTEFACALAEQRGGNTIILYEIRFAKESLEMLSMESPRKELEENLSKHLHAFWSKRQDGRQSEAIMSSMLRVGELRNQGLDIRIGSFGITSEQGLKLGQNNTSQAIYEAEAQNILEFSERYQTVIVLSGSAHARRHISIYEKGGIRDKVFAFLHTYGGGNEWNCQPNGCGVHKTIPFKSLPPSLDKTRSQIILRSNEDVPFDAFYFIPNNTAALPYYSQKK